MEHAFAQTHSAESFPKGLASRRNSGDSVACARDDRVGRSEGFAICHPERSAQREVEGSRAAPAEEGSTPAVAFEHVSKRFGDAVAVDDANLDIDEGAFVTIIGSSGCGKTTLLKMVNALAMPDDGRVLVHGKDTSGVDPIELRRNIGYAIQGSVLFPHLTVEQNIAYVPSLLNSGDEGRTEEAVAKWMDIIGLPHDIMDRYPAELSGGQAQRVGIARALAASPDILLADEPFSAVDAITRGSLQDEIKRIHRQTGITVLFVTHDIDEALDLGDKVLVMEAGRPARSCAAPPPSSSTAWLRASAPCTHDSAPPQIAALSEKAVPSRGSRPSHHYPEPVLARRKGPRWQNTIEFGSLKGGEGNRLERQGRPCRKTPGRQGTENATLRSLRSIRFVVSEFGHFLPKAPGFAAPPYPRTQLKVARCTAAPDQKRTAGIAIRHPIRSPPRIPRAARAAFSGAACGHASRRRSFAGACRGDDESLQPPHR